MNKLIKLLILIFGCIGQLSAQIPIQEKYWVITDSIQLEFNSSGLPTVSTSAFRGSGKNCSAAFSDSSGFRCYTNGTIFWDNTNQPMQGSIVFSNSYGNLSVTQVPFFIESELDTALLYCISISANGTQLSSSFYKLDKTQNSGLGAVIGAVSIPTDSAPGNQFANPVIVRQGDGTGWWMLLHAKDFNTYDSTNTWQLWALENDTFTSPTYQLIGERYFRELPITDLTFNPTGTKLVSASFSGILELYDFDRCTGLLANPIILSPRGNIQLNNTDTSVTSTDHGQYFGCAFSPSGRFLYANSRDTVWQFDLEADNIPTSSTVLWYDTLNIDSLNLATMELGPDGRIYIGACDTFNRTLSQIGPNYSFNPPNQYNSWLAVVNYPDSVGAGCDFMRHGLYLGGRGASGGLPRTYNTQLGVWVGSPCDPNVTGESPEKDQNAKLKVYPNPTNDKFNITWPVQGGYTWVLKSLAGSTLSSGTQQAGNATISTATLPVGMYFLEVHSAKEHKVEKVLVVR
jgi:hypothetical protein